MAPRELPGVARFPRRSPANAQDAVRSSPIGEEMPAQRPFRLASISSAISASSSWTSSGQVSTRCIASFRALAVMKTPYHIDPDVEEALGLPLRSLSQPCQQPHPRISIRGLHPDLLLI